jgi:hypothetical protein
LSYAAFLRRNKPHIRQIRRFSTFFVQCSKTGVALSQAHCRRLFSDAGASRLLCGAKNRGLSNLFLSAVFVTLGSTVVDMMKSMDDDPQCARSLISDKSDQSFH